MARLNRLLNCTFIVAPLAAAISYSSTSFAQEPLDEVRVNLKEYMPTLQIDSLRETPVQGLYELISQGQIAYVTEGGRYIITGDLIDMQTRQNLTTQVQNKQRQAIVASIPDEQKIIYPAVGEKKYEILILTDLSCPFCEKLHHELPALNEAGVEVHYLLTPRHGPGSPTFIESSKVMCSDDKKKLIDIAMKRQNIDGEACMDDLISQNLQLARELGMSGTPHIILPDGTPLPGFRPANEILAAIEQTAK
ncbi:MAG TPA: DsbC family protein [Halothiobacillaceae bacterium]|nr:DsbC family protein [Halothiobacillaceae bacterium]